MTLIGGLDEKAAQIPTPKILEELSKLTRWERLCCHPMEAARRLSKLLTPFGVGPVQIRQNGYNAKGYRLEDLTPLFAKHL